jgi:two-component system, NtrC family, sensor kinase
MRRHTLPLFWKFTIAIVLIVLVFATINVIVVWRHVHDAIQAELLHHASFIARSSASQAEAPLLYDDVVALQRIIDDMTTIDTSIVYAFIEDARGNVLAHSFDIAVPTALRMANRLADTSDISIRYIVASHMQQHPILDVAVPVMDRAVAQLRVGFREDAITESASVLLRWLLLMIGLFLVAGIAGAFVFARVITRPIKAVADAAANIGQAAQDSTTFPRVMAPDRGHIPRRLGLHIDDELDQLVMHFNEMILRLETTMTQLRRTQISLLQSEKLASIGTLAAGVAHEINNPLAGLKNCIRRMQRNPQDMERNAQYLSLIVAASEQISHVVEGLLDFTRRQDFELQPTDVHELLKAVLDLATYRFNSAGISVKHQNATPFPLLFCSPNHIKQVLLNLFFNSIDAIQLKRERGGNAGVIAVDIRRAENMLQLEIRDDGIGIAPRHWENVFDPFFTTKDVGKGTGLGLAVSYHLIRDHGGDISFDSREGEYTAFILTLPLYEEEATQ